MEFSDVSPQTLARQILASLDTLVREAEAETRPLEMDPYHRRLFELFAMAYRAGLTRDDAEADLTADGICQALARQWGLQQAMQNAASLPREQMPRMRSLWSIMRMWMEWTYAWDRHGDAAGGNSNA